MGSTIEYVDAVDSADQVISRVPRSVLRDQPFNYRVVHVLVVDGHRRLLLQKIASTKGRPFTWGSSVAGHVQAGESYERAASRECEEELGVRPREIRFVEKVWLDEAGRRKFIGVFVSAYDGPFVVDTREAERVEFVPIVEVRAWLRSGARSFSPTFERVFRAVDLADAWPS